jgi:hypothetical protein
LFNSASAHRMLLMGGSSHESHRDLTSLTN